MKLFDDIEKVAQPEVAQATKGERNRNPGNLEDGPFARSQPGYQGSDGRFAIFASEDHGRKAQETLLAKNYGGRSPASIIKKYAPAGDNSDASMRNYIGYISARAGINPDTVVPAAKLPALAQAMREFETGKTQKVKFQPYGGAIAGARQARTQKGGGNVARPDVLGAVDNVMTDGVASSQNVQAPGNKAFTSDAANAEGFNKLNTKLTKQQDVVTSLMAATETAQQTEVLHLESKLNERRVISDEITRANTQLAEDIKPTIEARARITAQREKINTMNPLERSIRGIFDLNYDEEFLSKQEQVFDDTLKTREEDFNYVNRLHSVALGQIDERYNLNTAMTSLEMEHAKEDATMIGLDIQATQATLNSTQAEISTQVQTVASQNQLRAHLMANLDNPTMIDLMNKAQANGGVIVHDGIPLTEAGLRDSIAGNKSKEMSLQAAQFAADKGEIEMAEYYNGKAMENMSVEELDGIISSGGMLNGVQFSTVDAMKIKLAKESYFTQAAQDAVSQTPGYVTLGNAAQVQQSTVQLFDRTKGLFKQGTPADSIMATHFRQTNATLTAMNEARKSGADPKIITALGQRFAVESAAANAHIEKTITDAVGGDKRMAAYMMGFARGVSPSQGSAAEMFTYAAIKGGLPEGLAASPETRQLMQKAIDVVQQNLTDKNGKVLSEAQLTSLVRNQVLSTARTTVGQAKFTRLWDSLPSNARADGHPLGRISESQWGSIQVSAEAAAAAGVAAHIGATPDQVKMMMRTGKPISTTPQHESLFKKFQSQAGRFNELEQREIVQSVDELAPVSPGQPNSIQLIDYLRSPGMHKRAAAATRMSMATSFGDYMMGPVVAGALESNIAEQAKLLEGGRQERNQDAKLAARRFDSAFAGKPVVRALTILKSIDGVGETGAKALMPVIQEFYAKNPRMQVSAQVMQATGGTMSSNSIVIQQEQAFLKFLQSSKFEDPAMEGYRKQTVRGWADSSTQSQTFMQNFLTSLNPVD